MDSNPTPRAVQLGVVRAEGAPGAGGAAQEQPHNPFIPNPPGQAERPICSDAQPAPPQPTPPQPAPSIAPCRLDRCASKSMRRHIVLQRLGPRMPTFVRIGRHFGTHADEILQRRSHRPGSGD